MVQSDTTYRCWRVKSCLKHEIWQRRWYGLPCNLIIGLHSSCLVELGQLFIPWHLTVLGTFFPHHVRNIVFFRRFTWFASLSPQIVLVMYQSDFCFDHLHHTSFLVIGMVNVVIFLVLHSWTGEVCCWYTLALKCQHTVLYHSISWLFHSITMLPDLL